MTEQTPQDIAAQALHLAARQLGDIFVPGSPFGKAVVQTFADAIAADRQQRDAVHAAEVARVRRETLLEAAALQCTHCRAGRPIVPPSNPVEHFAHQIKLSDPPAMREGWLICYAHEIHTLIAKEAAHVDA